MGQCNYCSLKYTRISAKESNKIVTTMPSSFMSNGLDIYIHKPEINVKKLNKEDREKYFVAWYMEVGTHCEC